MSRTEALGANMKLSTRLMHGSAIALIAGFAATEAGAQSTSSAPASTTVNEVVVTGTSIRGAAPVGASVVSVGQAQIQNSADQTVQDILKDVPAVVGLQSAGQGAFGSADASGTDAPSIHGLGASASNQTLVLIDGHRFPLTGVAHQLGDPNLLPTIALQRVEVLADGASSVYGSDAVAGVVNFITRNHYEGEEIDAQDGFGDHYSTASINAIAGRGWDTGWFYAAYAYSDKSALTAADRNYAGANHLAQGGTNLASFDCGQANIQPGGAGPIYTSSSGYTASVSSASTNAMCDYTGRNDLVPSEKRNSLFAKGEQELSDKLTFRGDIDYSDRQDVQSTAVGNVSATIYGPAYGNAAQINPYFIPINGNETSEKVYWAGDALLPPGHIYASAEDYFAHGELEYKFNDDWRLTFAGVYGDDTSRELQVGQLCTSCAYLALNGTTNSAGSLTAPSVASTGLIVTQALNANTALNPFSPTGTAALAGYGTLANLNNSTQLYETHSTMNDAVLKLTGNVFNLPAGPVKIAAGAELTNYGMEQYVTTPLGIGPASFGIHEVDLHYNRQVYSAYGEALIPVVSPSMDIPLVRRFDIDVSGRYDHYDDFGGTSNPKIGGNWELIQGLKLRAAYATSFTAPALTSVGAGGGVTGETSYGAYGLGAINVPKSAYPTVVNIPGVVCGATTCQVGAGTITGAQDSGGNANLKPQKGTSWSFGADYQPPQVHGLTLSVTFWHDEIDGAITAPLPSYAVAAPGLQGRLQIYPNGATPAQLADFQGARPQTSSVSTVYFTYDYTQGNVLDLDVEGLDFDVGYVFETGVGKFNLDYLGSFKTKFQQQFGTGTPWFSVLNTTGFNTTFPSIQFSSRMGIGWTQGPVAAEVYWDHTGSYYNWSGTTVKPITLGANGLPNGGGDSVAANDTFDVHAAYNFSNPGVLKGLQLYVDVTNLFDKAPPFYNSAYGYDTFAASPIGRVTSVGFRKKF